MSTLFNTKKIEVFFNFCQAFLTKGASGRCPVQRLTRVERAQRGTTDYQQCPVGKANNIIIIINRPIYIAP